MGSVILILALASAGTVLADDENLALGKPCQVFSSLVADGQSIAVLTDGQRAGACWSSQAFADFADHTLYPEYVVVDLGRHGVLRRVVLHTLAGDGLPPAFSIQVAREGEPWRTVVEKRDGQAPGNGLAQTFELPPESEGRYVKIEATRLAADAKGKYRFHLAELEVFGQAKPAAPLDAGPAPRDGKLRLTGLRCEHDRDPVGVDAEKPRLDWVLESPRRGERQRAYRILVASGRAELDAHGGDMWDSGRVGSDQSVAICYAGKPLESGQRYFWKVMAWDQDGQPTPWSEAASFVTGLFSPTDWRGQWIGAGVRQAKPPKVSRGALYLRKEIVVAQPIRRATAFVCGLGFGEFLIDGVKVGDGVMTPGFTTYDKRVQYGVYDVTEQFTQPGRKTLAAVLVDGWYGLAKDPWAHKFHEKPYVDQPKLRLDLHLELADGSRSVIASDGGWKCSSGEITRSWLCEEDVDRRKAQPGWDRPGFDERGWDPVVILAAPKGALVCQREPPTRVTAVLTPQVVKASPDKKAWYYNFGREFTGALRFRARGPAGTRIKVTVGAATSACEARVSYFTLAGQGVEEYAPRFCYQAIQRVTVEGLAAPPALEDLSAVELTGVGAVSGDFRCSNDLVNWLHESARRTHKAYTTYLPNDPSREYKAWTQDAQNMFHSASYLFDSRAMYERWQRDLLDTQADDGDAACVAPGPIVKGYNSTWWGGCIVWLPWQWYLQYGDPGLLFESYGAMKRYVDFLGRGGVGRIQNWGLRDWIPIEFTPPGIVNTPAYYLYAQVVSRTAALLGRNEEAARYAKVADAVRETYNRTFLDPASGIYGIAGEKAAIEEWYDKEHKDQAHELWWSGDRPCTQAGQALALALGLAPEAVRPQVEAALRREIAAHRNRVSTGFVATPYLLAVLADLAPDLGYAMTATRDYPSWYSMTAGASRQSRSWTMDHDLMQEGWCGRPVFMPSLGGNIAAWNMQALGGIRSDPAGPGFKKIIIRPNVVGDLHWVRSWYDSAHGRITSNWSRRGNQLLLWVTIPANTTATVHVPCKDAASVTENGQPAARAEGVRFIRTEQDRALYEVQSGSYCFGCER